MSLDVPGAVRFASESLARVGDKEKAVRMQAYMKTNMPFYGVQKPERTPILRGLVGQYLPNDREEYERLVLALWELPHREEKYLALGVAVAHRRFIVPDSLQLYQGLIQQGAWWDLVDEVATHLLRPLVMAYRDEVWLTLDRWVDDPDMWLRRAAIICQVGAKERTDAHRLFRYCAARAHEDEFFIRKAIGWALREFAKTDPGAVAAFVADHRERLSPLSYREATKHIGEPVEP